MTGAQSASLNADKGYDQMIREMLAAIDLEGEAEDVSTDSLIQEILDATPEMAEAAVS